MDLAAEAAGLDGEGGTDAGRFRGAEHAAELGVGGEDIFGGGHGFGAVGLAELLGDDGDGGELGLERVGEAFFAIHGGGAAGGMKDDGDLAFAIEDATEGTGGELAGFVVVGGEEAHVVVAVDAGVKDGDGDAGGGGAVERAEKDFAFRGGDGDAIDAAGDEAIEDLDLAGVVGFRGGAVPFDLDAVFFAGGHGAGLDGEPEEMGGGFGDHRDDFFATLLAAGE